MDIITNIAFNKITKQFGIIAYWNVDKDKAKIMDMGVWPKEDFRQLNKEQYTYLDNYTREIDINEGWHCPSEKLIEYVFN